MVIYYDLAALTPAGQPQTTTHSSHTTDHIYRDELTEKNRTRWYVDPADCIDSDFIIHINQYNNQCLT